MKIYLINMPFASLFMPSLALTQLKSVLDKELGSRVSVEILYLNHHFGLDMSARAYSLISEGMQGLYTGLGDWFFRAAAFPELEDNSQDYFGRYRYQFGDQSMALYRDQLLAMRNGLDGYLDRLIEMYHIDHADIVGFSSMFFQNLASAAMARRIKARNPNIISVLGGANCEAQMGIELAHHLPNIDYVFSGPALISFPQLVSLLLAGKRTECESIDGVFTKNNSKSMADLPPETTGGKNRPSQLNGIGILGRELDINVPVELDYGSFLDSFHRFFPKGKLPKNSKKPFLLFETSRGCWWGQKSHCTFCGLNGGTMNYRAMNADSAVGLVQGLVNKYSNDVDHFSCVDNILPKNYLKDFLPRLEIPAHVSIFYEVKADLKEPDIQALARAQVLQIQPGIESLASSTLRLMRKGTTSFGNIQFLRNVAIYGIKPTWNLLIGFPGESEDVYKKYLRDLPLLVHLPPPNGAFPVRFDRFSPYFYMAEEYKLELESLDFYNFCYPFPKPVLQNMAYYFYDNKFDAQYAVNAANYVKPLDEMVGRWRTRWDQEDKSLLPKLFFKPDSTNVIYDSRRGGVTEHFLSESELTLLKGLDSPLSVELLSKNYSQFDQSQTVQILSQLSEKGLLFHENDRWVSLVYAREPTPLQKHVAYL